MIYHGEVKLSDALMFSRERKAYMLADLEESEWNPAIDNVVVVATDYGIETEYHVGPMERHSMQQAWSEMDSKTRQLLLKSEKWEPIDPKPAMVIIAEAACDWTVHEDDSQDEAFEEEGYPA